MKKSGSVLVFGLALAMPFAQAMAQGAGKAGAGGAKGKGKAPAAAAAPAKPKLGVALTAAQLEAFRADLASRELDKATAAADALGKASGTASSAAVVNILLDQLALGTSPKLSMAILDALSFHKSAAALEALSHYARNRNDELRVKALYAIAATPDKAAVPLLMRALHDSAGSVRAVAANALAQRKEMGAAETLMALLKRGDDSAASALGKLATPDLAAKLGDLIGDVRDDLLSTALGGLLMRDDLKDEVKLEVVRALGKIPGEMSLAALAEYIAEPAGKVKPPSRVEAEKILGERQ